MFWLSLILSYQNVVILFFHKQISHNVLVCLLKASFSLLTTLQWLPECLKYAKFIFPLSSSISQLPNLQVWFAVDLMFLVKGSIGNKNGSHFQQ